MVFGSENIGIRTINADGSHPAQLLDFAVSNPAWSPDGKKIAFNKVVTPDVPESVDAHPIPSLAVINADGSNLRKLLKDTASEPAWSPDGKKIAFTRIRDGDLSSIYVMNADGTGYPRRLTTGSTSDASPAWSPDGTKIAFQSSRRSPNGDIYIINACCEESTTNKVQPLTNNRGYNGSSDPTWSPDGKKIAFTSIRNGRASSIYVMNADGSGRTRLTEHAENGVSSPTWSPDGAHIAFVKYASTFQAIYTMEADGSEPTLVRKIQAEGLTSVDWR